MVYAKIDLNNKCEGYLFGVTKQYAISQGCTLLCPDEIELGDTYKNGRWYKQDTEEEIAQDNLIRVKRQLQEENKKALNDFLVNKTVLWRGEEYSVTEQDQNEMGLKLIQHQIGIQVKTPFTLEWHSKGKKCKIFTEEDFKNLILKIVEYVHPYRKQQEEIKERIYSATTYEELFNIEIKYE